MIPLLAFLAAASVIATNAAADFLQLGFMHILPYGLDHVLFVLSLFFCCRDFAALLAQVTLFTVAHSLSLGVAVLGGWDPPSRVVETAIALSIVFVAMMNILRKNKHSGWASYALTFCFGLVHGLGFADAFRHAAGSASDFVVALLGFNVGVELGQLVVVLAAFILLGRYWEKVWYRYRIAVPASVGIALVALYWAGTRLMA